MYKHVPLVYFVTLLCAWRRGITGGIAVKWHLLQALINQPGARGEGGHRLIQPSQISRNGNQLVCLKLFWGDWDTKMMLGENALRLQSCARSAGNKPAFNCIDSYLLVNEEQQQQSSSILKSSNEIGRGAIQSLAKGKNVFWINQQWEFLEGSCCQSVCGNIVRLHNISHYCDRNSADGELENSIVNTQFSSALYCWNTITNPDNRIFKCWAEA